MTDVAGADERSELLRGAGSLLLGAVFSWCLFQAVARYLHQGESAPPVAIEDLREVFLPQPPPPPAPVQFADDSAPALVPGFELAPSDSATKVSVSPPTFTVDDSAPPAPSARITIGSYSPKAELSVDPNRVYQLSEVDRRPSVIYRTTPNIPEDVRGGAAFLRAVFIFVVDAQGGVGNVRVLHPSGQTQFDTIVAESIKDWKFQPAIRRGKPVRCLMEEAVTVRWSSQSKFQL